MEKSNKELELVEFEKLFYEIPNATSIAVDSCKGPHTEKLSNNGTLHNVKTSITEAQQSVIRAAQMQETRLPDDQSLVSAFSEFNINGGLARGDVNVPLADCLPLHNEKLMLGNHYHNGTRYNLDVDAQVSNMYPLELRPRVNSCSYDEFVAPKLGQDYSNFYRLNVQGVRRQQAGCFQSTGNSNGAIPISNGIQLVSGLPYPALELPLMPNQQQYLADAQSSLAYFHPQQMNMPQVTGRNIEEEQFLRLYHQAPYLQQLFSHQLEAQNSIPANANYPTRIVNQNPRQRYYDLPLPHRHEQQEQGPFSHKCSISRCLKQSNIGVSSDAGNAQVFDRISQRNFSETILARAQDLNALRAMKFGSGAGHGSFNHMSQNGKAILNGQICHSLCNPTAGCFHSNVMNSMELPHDMMYHENANFRTPSHKFECTGEFNGHIYQMAKDQQGCRLLQKNISEGTPSDVEKIFSEVINHIVELMTDPFGNYLVQKLLEVCDEDQQTRLLHEITRVPGDLIHVSCEPHGTRAVQKVIDILKTPENISIVVNALKPGIVSLMKDMNGNHVAQRCLVQLAPKYSQFLYEAAIDNCIELATDRHGCCVLQKCLGSDQFVGEQLRRLMYEIITNALVLAQDQFGNYVVQFILENGMPQAVTEITKRLEGRFGDLSVQKYSSNVVEKCIKKASGEQRGNIIQELIADPRLDQIMQDPYGNYVIQCALTYAEGDVTADLAVAIEPHIPTLRTSPYGKKILSHGNFRRQCS